MKPTLEDAISLAVDAHRGQQDRVGQPCILHLLRALDCVTRGKGEAYEAFVLRSKANPIARKVKLADLDDNMDIRAWPA